MGYKCKYLHIITLVLVLLVEFNPIKYLHYYLRSFHGFGISTFYKPWYHRFARLLKSVVDGNDYIHMKILSSLFVPYFNDQNTCTAMIIDPIVLTNSEFYFRYCFASAYETWGSILKTLFHPPL